MLFAEGEVLQASAFGAQLLLQRRVEARIGEWRLAIHDNIMNVGHDPTPHMLLYHVNVGWPVIDEDTELLVPATVVEPRGDHSVEGYRTMHGPVHGYVEQVFEYDVAAEPDDRVPVALVNRRLGLGAYEVFRRDQLPYHFVWRMLGEGTYVVGIELSTNRSAGRIDAPYRGELIELDRARAVRTTLSWGHSQMQARSIISPHGSRGSCNRRPDHPAAVRGNSTCAISNGKCPFAASHSAPAAVIAA